MGFPTPPNDSGPPTGPAGGDLTGSTYPNPDVAAGTITTAKLAAAVTLDAIGAANPATASVALNLQKITGLSNGSSAQDAATFGQIPLALSSQRFATGLLVPPFPSFSTVVGTANRAYLVRFLSTTSMTVTKMTFVTTLAATNNDNCDVGIFSADGTTLLGSAGSTAGKLNATAGVQTVSISSLTLVAGTVYYAAFAYGTVGGTAATLGINTTQAGNSGALMGATLPNVMQAFQASAFPLTAPFTSAGPTANGVLLGLLL